MEVYRMVNTHARRLIKWCLYRSDHCPITWVTGSFCGWPSIPCFWGGSRAATQPSAPARWSRKTKRRQGEAAVGPDFENPSFRQFAEPVARR
jgi:hypothetical protein